MHVFKLQMHNSHERMLLTTVNILRKLTFNINNNIVESKEITVFLQQSLRIS